MAAQEQELLRMIEERREDYKNQETDEEKIQHLESTLDELEEQIRWFD